MLLFKNNDFVLYLGEKLKLSETHFYNYGVNGLPKFIT